LLGYFCSSYCYKFDGMLVFSHDFFLSRYVQSQGDVREYVQNQVGGLAYAPPCRGNEGYQASQWASTKNLRAGISRNLAMGGV
jgi:hypothetical protein